MDQPWEYSQWDHTANPALGSWIRPSRPQVEKLRSSLIETTKRLVEQPYSPLLWHTRAQTLLDLGFPELAVAEAYKGLLLVKSALDYGSEFGETIRLRYHQNLPTGIVGDLSDSVVKSMVKDQIVKAREGIYGTIIESLFVLCALPSAIAVCGEAIRLHPGSQNFRTWLQQGLEVIKQIANGVKATGIPFEKQKECLLYGPIPAKVYPWMSNELRNSRNKKMIGKANKELKTVSTCLEIKKSPISNSSDKDTRNPCYGMFAIRAIKPSEQILKAKHPFGVSLEHGDNQCYNCFKKLSETTTAFPCCPKVRYCDSECQDVAEVSYHKTICGKSCSGIIARAQNSYGGKNEKPLLGPLTSGAFADNIQIGYPARNSFTYPDQIPLFLARMFAVCIQAGGHPLMHPNVAQLMTGDTVNPTVTWNMNGFVVGPIEVLQELGVDIWADQKWESWVWMTMWYRVRNNCKSDPEIEIPNIILSPFYSWFNHSCDPKACSNAVALGCSDEEMDTSFALEKGDEVFVSYLDAAMLRKGRDERRKVLRAWIGSDCMCQRCVGSY